MYVKWKIINKLIYQLFDSVQIILFYKNFPNVREQGAVTKETQGTGIRDAVLIKF